MLRRLPTLAALAACTFLASTSARADVDMTLEPGERIRRAPNLFSNGMVVQRELPVPIWGRADPGEQVTVSFNGQEKVVATGPDGRWRVDLDPMPAGGPMPMTISGNNTVVIEDVRIGEVWVAAGQSNMRRRRVRRTVLAENPDIRGLVRRDWNDQPGTVPWIFATNLQAALGVPVGILNLAAGGTNVVLWLGETAENDPNPDVQEFLRRRWGFMYQKFVAPVQPFRIRGVVWWQGEADLRRPLNHRALYPAVIRSWRAEWGIGDFPWISMQVPSGRGRRLGSDPDPLPAVASATDQNAFIRHTYLRALEEFPLTSFASNLELEGGTHPVDTLEYASRLSDQALALVYGWDFAYAGPMYSSMQVEGSMLRVRYRDNTDDGLAAFGGGPLQGFAITDDEQTWHWADAVVDGNDVLLSSAAVPAPVAARYAWGNRPTWANLVNAAGFSAAPFATDVSPGEYGP